ncbi:MAG: YaeQ family protein [Advenella sp.]|uniref:YaeQ family protein n=1 Tax=Advenella sp. TaxID=1872388 RepID=UPI00258A391E|nr:YaeQ family protein [Advenella sp.]MDD3757924.1 YaeQ family protein [Advenella sp.]
MALGATIYKAEINIADNDRAYYGSHAVTVARHPSETEERLMIRILGYALYENGDEMLAFTRGLSEVDEPDLWRKDLTGTILQWIETGLPDERRLLKACGRAGQVIVLAYGRNAATWWTNVASKLERARNLKVYVLPVESTQKLASLADRNMTLHFNVQDATVWVSSDKGDAQIEIQALN